jgi:hypothetical protein
MIISSSLNVVIRASVPVALRRSENHGTYRKKPVLILKLAPGAPIIRIGEAGAFAGQAKTKDFPVLFIGGLPRNL